LKGPVETAKIWGHGELKKAESLNKRAETPGFAQSILKTFVSRMIKRTEPTEKTERT